MAGVASPEYGSSTGALPFLCGVVEGFYGRPWRDLQRGELMQWMRGWGLNAYLYAPKDDRKHRAGWRDPYTSVELGKLEHLIKLAAAQSVEFIYAISPGLDITYSSEEEFWLLQSKIKQVQALGCRSFAILFDDIMYSLKPADAEVFASFAHAQTHVTNRLLETVECRRMLFCPTEYCASFCAPSMGESPYLREVGELLDARIQILWTGPTVVSDDIPEASIIELRNILKRKPVIWDNLHANDYDRRRLFLGPYANRPHQLLNHIEGVLSNPNCEFHANFMPLHTLATWIREGPLYDPTRALEQAVADWLPNFAGNNALTQITTTDVMLLVNLFYLPHYHSQLAQELLSDLEALADTPHSHPDWNRRCNNLMETCNQAQALFQKFTNLVRRDVLYDLFPFVWDLQRLSMQLQQTLEAVIQGGAVPRKAPPKPEDPQAPPPKPHPMGVDLELCSGGVVGVFRRLLESTWQPVREPTNYNFRYAIPSDHSALAEICLQTYSLGCDATHEFPNFASAPGELWVAPYLSSPNCISIVLEDSLGVCGYALIACSSETFYRDMEDSYLPNLRNHYPTPGTHPNTSACEEQLLAEIHNATSRWIPQCEQRYPAHVQLCLLPRAQHQGNGRKFMSVIQDQLRQRGIPGLHLSVNLANRQALAFFLKAGFSEPDEDLGCAPGSHFVVLARSITQP